jgi:hypothetical protein
VVRCVAVMLCLSADVAMAGEAPEAGWVRSPAFEVNLLWPFFPGGLEDLKVLFPVVRADQPDWGGELVSGLSSDFSFGPLSRPVTQYGKVGLLTARVGYRQFLAYGLQLEASVNLGWRHEAENVHDGTTLDGAYGRLWLFAGWQYDLTRRVYLNLRGDAGIILFRTDRYGYTERQFIPAAEINLGVRF